MGGKVALTLAAKYPHLVDGLVSIDSPPVDRNPYPHMNKPTSTLVIAIFKISDTKSFEPRSSRTHL